MAVASKSARIISLYLKGKTYGQIAKLVQVTHGRVSSTIHRARKTGRIQPHFTIRPGPNAEASFRKGMYRPVKKHLAARLLAIAGKRKCPRCSQVKRVGARSWVRDNASSDGWRPLCKLCDRERKRRDYKEQKRRIIRGEA